VKGVFDSVGTCSSIELKVRAAEDEGSSVDKDGLGGRTEEGEKGGG
jgi:hypothetical protein